MWFGHVKYAHFILLQVFRTFSSCKTETLIPIRKPLSTACLSSNLWQPLTTALSNTPPYLNLDLSWTVFWYHVSDWMPALPWTTLSSPRFSHWLLWPSVSWRPGIFIQGLDGRLTWHPELHWFFQARWLSPGSSARPLLISLWFCLWDFSRKFLQLLNWGLNEGGFFALGQC